MSYSRDPEMVIGGTEAGGDAAAGAVDPGAKTMVNVVVEVMIMSDGALTMADGGEFSVASEPGAGPGIGEEPHIELRVDSVPVVLSVPGPNLYHHTNIIWPKIMGPTCTKHKEETIER